MPPYIILALLPLVSAANLIFACTRSLPTTGEFLPVPGGSAGRADECARRCEAGGVGRYDTTITYSYFDFGTGACRCYPSAPPANTFSTCSALGEFIVGRIRTTFEYEGCYPGVQTAPFERTTLDACFSECRTSRAMDFAPVIAQNLFRCTCYAIPPTPNAVPGVTCDAGATNFYRLTHDALSATQGLNRRRRVKAGKEEDYCPGSLTACKVPGSRGYECIDTSSELESCGGCMHGEYSVKRKSQAKGINCSTLDRAVIGVTTCKSGRCVDEF